MFDLDNESKRCCVHGVWSGNREGDSWRHGGGWIYVRWGRYVCEMWIGLSLDLGYNMLPMSITGSILQKV